MFTSNTKGSEAPAPSFRETRPAPRGIGETSIISADLKVVGNLISAGDIQIKGTVEGDVKSRSVTIGEGAQVTGAIVAETVHISGAIKGQVEAPTVTVDKTARINGDIVHQTLSIEAGAHMEGNCRRLEAKRAPDSASVAPLKATVGDAGKKAVTGV